MFRFSPTIFCDENYSSGHTILKAEFLSLQKTLADMFFDRNQSRDTCSHGFCVNFQLLEMSTSGFSLERKSAFSKQCSSNSQ